MPIRFPLMPIEATCWICGSFRYIELTLTIKKVRNREKCVLLAYKARINTQQGLL